MFDVSKQMTQAENWHGELCGTSCLALTSFGSDNSAYMQRANVLDLRDIRLRRTSHMLVMLSEMAIKYLINDIFHG